MKEEKNMAKETLNTTALAQFFFGPGRRQAGAIRAARLGFQGMTATAPSTP